jgi:hypothetical protein
MPFGNLFAAEKYYQDQGSNLSWEKIRPAMNAMYGDIENLYSDVEGSDILAEPNKQKVLNDVQLYLSELKKEKKKVDIKRSNKVTIPEIRIQGLEKGLEAIANGKRGNSKKFPHKLPAGTKWEDFIIKFIDAETVLIKVKQFEHNSNFREMGFIGRGKNPTTSEAWKFLKVLAERGGELTIKDHQAKDRYKKQKELLASSLKEYFSIDYDPFYPYRSSLEKNGDSYKIKITLIPLAGGNKDEIIEDVNDDLGIKEYLDTHAPQVSEEE